MIITRPKPIEEILNILKNFPRSKIGVVGCGICARKMKTGGEAQVMEMVEELRRAGLDLTEGVTVKHACSAGSWEKLTEEHPQLKEADIMLVMSCGAGVSFMGRLSQKPTLPALDTTSLGGARGEETLIGLCCMCGECNVGMFAGLCPKAGCPKSQLNGPCGGSDDGNCEVSGLKCIWTGIFELLKSRGMLAILDEMQQPQKHNRRL